jgi:hypothetical protein
MKQNAKAAQTLRQPIAGADGRVVQQDATLVLLASALERLKQALPKIEIHLIGHSAGSILFGHLLDALIGRKVTVSSCTLTHRPAASSSPSITTSRRWRTACCASRISTSSS